MKRILAWIGLVYMILLMIAQMYFMLNGGVLLYGWWGLLACPVCGGALALGIHELRKGEWTKFRCKLLIAVSAIAFACFLYIGIVGLMQNF